MIIDSGGARASKDQLKQLSAIKGLVVDPLGKIVELPTKSNYREGLSFLYALPVPADPEKDLRILRSKLQMQGI